jgi:hypothetical protein
MMENGWTERIEELEAEVAKLAAEWDADRRREYGYSQQTVDALTVERDKLEAENAALKEYRTAEARRRGHKGNPPRTRSGGVGMQEVRLNLYQCDREFQIEIGGGGFGYRLLGPKFDGSSRLIKSVILSDRDKEEIIGYVKPDAKAIEEELADYKAAKERDELEANNAKLRALRQIHRDTIRVMGAQL